MLKIYNTLTRQKDTFTPLQKNTVSMYVCGPTVYDQPHIGHARSAYVFDVIRRYLEYRGYRVTFVRNVTDVDDKIIAKARQEFPEEPITSAVTKVSHKYLESYSSFMDRMGIRKPDIEPKATAYIRVMQDFIQLLIERGMAYVAGHDVYFDVRKKAEYGKLSHQSFEMMETGTRALAGEVKKNPLDFALWKSAKPEEPSWESPWGKGRPGWHIECSAMSSDILGDEFDIHGGGIDLVFPHHENEIAQSEGAGKKFARYWIHNGLLTINKEKMAKSLGNFVPLETLLEKYPADVLKILFLQAHYASPVDFTWEKMDAAKKAYESIMIAFEKMDRLGVVSSPEIDSGNLRQKFIDAMNDDFNTPRALSVLFEGIHEYNRALAASPAADNASLASLAAIVHEIAAALGLQIQSQPAVRQSNTDIESLIACRHTAKKEKNFARADSIRKELESKGIILEDARDGTTSWRYKL